MKKFLSALAVLIAAVGCVCVSAQETIVISPCENLQIEVNGEKIEENAVVTSADKIIIRAEDAVVIEAENVYFPANEEFSVTKSVNFENAHALKIGLVVENGAQVRIGQKNIGENGKIDSLADSGLRFVATADYSGTLIADENVEFGLKIVAEQSTNEAYVKAEKFQDKDKSVFTVALTNMKESNFNRLYTATAYAKATMFDGTTREFYANSVSRSIYQVSVGILKNGSGESGVVSDMLYNVLNSYVNQTGIRLEFESDSAMSAKKDGNGKYTGDVFFDVESCENEDKSTSVTIRALGKDDGFLNSVSIASWWKDYVRINNNHSVAKGYICNEKIEDNVLSFDFVMPGKMDCTFDYEAAVFIVEEVGDDYIKGFRNGEEETLDITSCVKVLGLGSKKSDIVCGSVILEGYDSDGKVSAVEMLATAGVPMNAATFEECYGEYLPWNNSEKYTNVVAKMTKKRGNSIVCINGGDEKSYSFASSYSKCTRVIVTKDGDDVSLEINYSNISDYPSIFENTSKYNNYVYLKCNNETGKVEECVYYCVPKKLDFSGDGEYSDIFSLKE